MQSSVYVYGWGIIKISVFTLFPSNSIYFIMFSSFLFFMKWRWSWSCGWRQMNEIMKKKMKNNESKWCYNLSVVSARESHHSISQMNLYIMHIIYLRWEKYVIFLWWNKWLFVFPVAFSMFSLYLNSNEVPSSSMLCCCCGCCRCYVDIPSI